jgi:hypothetical protein
MAQHGRTHQHDHMHILASVCVNVDTTDATNGVNVNTTEATHLAALKGASVNVTISLVS